MGITWQSALMCALLELTVSLHKVTVRRNNPVSNDLFPDYFLGRGEIFVEKGGGVPSKCHFRSVHALGEYWFVFVGLSTMSIKEFNIVTIRLCLRTPCRSLA